MKKIFNYAVILMGLFMLTACPDDDDNESSETSVNTEPRPLTSDVAIPVDLGLSVLWADRNLKAIRPELQGFNVGWGESFSKKFYYNNYRDSYIFYGDAAESAPMDISGTHYDAATTEWGGKWRMPTKAEVEELIRKCKFTKTATDYGLGVTVEGTNGNSIFLPCTYRESGITTNKAVQSNRYWTSTLSSKGNSVVQAYDFGFGLINTIDEIGEKAKLDIGSVAGQYGKAIRPVADK